jgi:hypothetical protein
MGNRVECENGACRDSAAGASRFPLPPVARTRTLGTIFFLNEQATKNGRHVNFAATKLGLLRALFLLPALKN